MAKRCERIDEAFERALHAESRSSLYDSYDSMNRLLDYERGTLASGGGSISTAIGLPGTHQEQAYNLDGLGNWSTTILQADVLRFRAGEHYAGRISDTPD